MNVCGVTFGGYITKILSFKTGNLLNSTKKRALRPSALRADETQHTRGIVLTPWTSPTT